MKLPGGGKARLMCDKHPAGPLDVPDPANYKDIKVNKLMSMLCSNDIRFGFYLFVFFQSYEKCFSLCQYTLSLILKELNRLLLVVDPAPPKVLFRPKTFQDFELAAVEAAVLLAPTLPPLHQSILPPSPQLSPPQPPPPDLEDKVNFPSRVREVEDTNVSPIPSSLQAASLNNQKGHLETFDLFMVDFPWKV